MNTQSFAKYANVNHTKLRPGLYVARVDGFGITTITTLDLRLVTPNSIIDRPIEPAALHTIAHLGNLYLREYSELRRELVYFGPNGSRTGFSAVYHGNYHLSAYRRTFEEMAKFIVDWNQEIPGATAEECGNYLDHNLLAAKNVMQKWLRVLIDHRHLDYDPFHYPI